MSKEDLQREDDLKRSFDSIVLLVNELQEEKTQIEIKFGISSKLRNTKHRQQQVIKDFYNSTLSYINYMRDLNYIMAINYRALDLIVMQKETGLTWEKVNELTGFTDSKEIDKIKKVDIVLSRLYADLKKIDPSMFKK